jgi:hypothetical protein
MRLMEGSRPSEGGCRGRDGERDEVVEDGSHDEVRKRATQRCCATTAGALCHPYHECGFAPAAIGGSVTDGKAVIAQQEMFCFARLA